MPHRFETRAVHAGREDLTDLGLHAVPLDLSTTYPARDTLAEAERLDRYATGELLDGPPIYGRVSNLTVARFEQAMADLEGSEAAVAFATGMAALTAFLLAVRAEGRPHVVAVRPLYGTTDHLLGSGLLGTTVTWTTPDGIAASITPETGFVLIETPANPTLAEHDITAIAKECHPVPLMVDNTFATPVLQHPLERGADLVWHSATKFIGGHGDAFGGVIACDEQRARMLRQIRYATGGILHPSGAYLHLRGLSTLPVRVRAAAATAQELAQRLSDHPKVGAVHYPGLRTARPAGQMESGGALVAFEVDVDPVAFVRSLRIVTPAVSLGSVDSLIQHPASLTHRIISAEDRSEGGITDRLLRLSVGLESCEDLWADLDRAFLAAG